MRRVATVAAAVFLAALAILLLSWTSYFNSLNDMAYDFTMRLAGPLPPSPDIVLVVVDDESLARVGRWPWSRDRLAAVIRGVAQGPPRVTAIDLLLDDRSETASDRELADAIAAAGPVVLATRLDAEPGREFWREPLKELVAPMVSLAHVHADPDLDGINRRILSAKVAGGRVVPAFSVQCAELLTGALGGGVRVIRPEPIAIRFVGDRHSFPMIPAWQVIEGAVPSDRFRGKLVLIGSTAEGLGDQWITPFSVEGSAMSGLEIHANAVDTIVARRQIREISNPAALLLLAGLLFSLWWLDRVIEGWRFYAVALAGIPLLVVISVLSMHTMSLWMPFPPMIAAVVLAVPALEVARISRVRHDLDEKIARLSSWGQDRFHAAGPLSFRMELESRVRDEGTRRAWLDRIDAHERTVERLTRGHESLMAAAVRDSRWKLGAVDYFNEQLYRFLSFNEAILASIEDMIVVADVAGAVVYQNPAARRLDGFDEKPESLVTYATRLIPRVDWWNVVAQAIAGSGAVTVPMTPSADGQRFFNVTVAPISTVGVVISLHDATAQRELDQAKNDMISLVSHELRTPLTSIRGFGEMLLKYDLVAEKGRPFLGTILDESQRLTGLIQSFLDVAYIESGRQALRPVEFAPSTVLADVAASLKPVAEEKGIRLEVVEGRPSTVHADHLLIRQAVSNLVTNAIKYSPPSTTVRLEGTNGAGVFRIHVRDEGFGIPEEDLPKLFDKFFRRDNPETREQSGFGLGLAFVREVAVKHGGDVDVESKVGSGSTFTLWIPVK